MNQPLTPLEREQRAIAAALKDLADVLKGPDRPTSTLNAFWRKPATKGERGVGAEQSSPQQPAQGPTEQQVEGQAQQRTPAQQQDRSRRLISRHPNRGGLRARLSNRPKSEPQTQKSVNPEKAEGSS